jgi:hypothetical protein
MNRKVAVAGGLIIRNSNNNMAGKTILILMLLSCAVLPPAGAQEAAEGKRFWRPVLGLGILGAIAVADEPVGSGYPEGFFTPKAQAVGALRASLDLPLFYPVALGIGFQLHGITASNPAGGWIYRSHWGAAFRFCGSYEFQLSEPSRPLQLTLGISAGGSFNFDLVTYTTLFLYYPGIFLEPRLELNNVRHKNHSLALVLPIDYYFRRDLGYYGSVGLGAVWRYTRR